MILLPVVLCINRMGHKSRGSEYHRHLAKNTEEDPLCKNMHNSDSSSFEQGININGFVKNPSSGHGTVTTGFGQRLGSYKSGSSGTGSKSSGFRGTAGGVTCGSGSGSCGFGYQSNYLKDSAHGEGYELHSGNENIRKSAYISEIEARSKLEGIMSHQAAKERIYQEERDHMLRGEDWRDSPNWQEPLSWQKDQDWKDIQRFQNVENFENFRRFQKYREPQPLNETKHDEYPSFSKGIELKFTNMSTTTRIDNYVRIFSASKIFKIETKEDTTAYVNLVSTTRHYHPQFRIYELRGHEFVLLQNINFNNKFFFASNGLYVLEIGTDSNIVTDPFENIKYGGFICIISSEIRTIEEILNDEEIKVSMWGYEGYCPFTHNTDLSLFLDSYKFLSHGICNYQITPFYDTSRHTLSIYYHRGSTQRIGQIMRASTVEISCNRISGRPRIFYGKEPRPAMYHFEVECKRICDLFELLE